MAKCIAMLITAVGVLLVASPGAAQFSETERTLWGVSASFVPNWTTADRAKIFHRADDVELSGSSFQIGYVRGTWLGGDSGWSFFRQRIDNGSFLTRDGAKFETTGPTTFSGIQYRRFVPVTTIRERVQVGAMVVAGVGWYRGQVSRDGERVLASALSGLAREDEQSLWVPAPMLKIGAAAAVLAGAGFKGRVTVGYSFLTGREVGFDIVYLIGGD